MSIEAKTHAAAVRMMVTKRPEWRRELTAIAGGSTKLQHGAKSQVSQKPPLKKGDTKEKSRKS